MIDSPISGTDADAETYLQDADKLVNKALSLVHCKLLWGTPSQTSTTLAALNSDEDVRQVIGAGDLDDLVWSWRCETARDTCVQKADRRESDAHTRTID